MKLISCTEFVLEQNKSEEVTRQSYIRCREYANFLQQPLTLSMFVPCNDKGEVLEDPTFDAYMQPKEMDKQYSKWLEAKENVIFEGFEFKGETDFNWIFKHNGIFPVMISKSRNIEYLTTILKKHLTITPKAVEKYKLK